MNPFHGTIIAGEHINGTKDTKFTIYTQDSGAEIVLNKKVLVSDLNIVELSILRDLRYYLLSLARSQTPCCDPELDKGITVLSRFLNLSDTRRPTKD